MASKKNRVLILGASGFLGQSIYKEFSPYFKTFGTYYSNEKFKKNNQFFKYDCECDDIVEHLERINPDVIISALRGEFSYQLVAHQHLFQYAKMHKYVKIIFLSSSNVFDAYSKYPSYENDTTLSNSIYGHFKIRVEQQLLKLPKKQVVIMRLPMVFGVRSPRIEELKTFHELDEFIELFPNLVMNICWDTKITQHLHYIVNRNKYGIFHCASTDLVHHEDFIKDLIRAMGLKHSKYKFVYTTNDERYLAVMPKYNTPPKHLLFESNSLFQEIKRAY
jgi:dTDP-4-dehydrorhamnose reductase